MASADHKTYAFFFQTVHDPESFAKYPAMAMPLVKKYNGKLAAKAAMKDAPYAENKEGFQNCTVIEFPSEKAAVDWYGADETQPAMELRKSSTSGPFIIAPALKPEGLDGHKGLVVGMLKVEDPSQMKLYNPSASVVAYQGKVVARTNAPLESEDFVGQYSIAVILSFPTVELATAWMGSEEYKEMYGLRLASSSGPFVVVGAN